MTIHLDIRIASRCRDCGFASNDIHLLNNHNCDVQKNGGHCEDYPCCGHEFGDCNGLKYGSDEAIKDLVYNGISYKYCEECETSCSKDAEVCPTCGSEELEWENISYDELDSTGYFEDRY
jgi:hypothetical protein